LSRRRRDWYITLIIGSSGMAAMRPRTSIGGDTETQDVETHVRPDG
jgi:hypothetical protein